MAVFWFNQDDFDIRFNGAPEPSGYLPFNSEAELLALFAKLELSKDKVTEVYNAFAGVPPFQDLAPWGGRVKNHKYGAKRIWAAIQKLSPDAERIPWNESPDPPATDESPVDAMLDVEGDRTGLDTTAPVSDPEGMTTTKRKGLTATVTDVVESIKKPRKAKGSKVAKPARAKKEPKPERKHRVKGESKKDQAAQLMLRKSGATLEDFKKLGWNEGSVTMFSQWVALVVRNGIKSFYVEKTGKGEKVFKAVA
jgi:hypothetical protein